MSKFFHGDDRRDNHFWVYPKCKPISSSWDTHNLETYCNNHKFCHTFINHNITEYVCLGHDINENIWDRIRNVTYSTKEFKIEKLS